VNIRRQVECYRRTVVRVIATVDATSMIRDRGGRLFVWLAPGRA
jgi:hypothetical protein